MANFKKMFIVGMAILGLSALSYASPVYAEETGPVYVQSFNEPGYVFEITVNLMDAETNETVKTFKLNSENKWVQKADVPVGRYKIFAGIEGLKPRATTKISSTFSEKEVVANPQENRGVDTTPRFVAIEGSEKYIERNLGLVDFVRRDGSMAKGEMSNEELDDLHNEAIYSQNANAKEENEAKFTPDTNNDVAGPGQADMENGDYVHARKNTERQKDADIENEYVPTDEELKEIAKKDKIKSVDDKKSNNLLKWTIGITTLAFIYIATFLWLKFKK